MRKFFQNGIKSFNFLKWTRSTSGTGSSKSTSQQIEKIKEKGSKENILSIIY
jgi:hypothetical protein